MSFVHFFQQTVEPANAQAQGQGQVQTSQVPAVAISPQGIQSRNLNINFFLNGPTPASFLFIYGLFIQTIQFLQQKM